MVQGTYSENGEKNKKNIQNKNGGSTTQLQMAPAKPRLLHNPGPARREKQGIHALTSIAYAKLKRCFSPTHLDKGTLDTAAWIVFVGVLRSKQRWKTKRAVPLKMYAPQARTFFCKEKKRFPKRVGWAVTSVSLQFFFSFAQGKAPRGLAGG